METQEGSSFVDAGTHMIEFRPAEPSIGELMLGQAMAHASHHVLEATAKGEAVSLEIRRALMEMAREELYDRTGQAPSRMVS